MLRALLLTVMAVLLVRLPIFKVIGTTPDRGRAEPGERETRALAAAWPGDITAVGKRGGDWAVQVHGTWFSWAEGRLLPDDQVGERDRFAPIPFYSYPLSLPPLPKLDAGSAARLRQRVADELLDPPRRSEAFFGTLLEARNRAQTEAQLVKMEVAGFTVTVHRRLRAPLMRVSDELRSLRAQDPAVASFLRGLVEMNGYNYRYVEGTRSRSFHSYGLAVDLIPRTYGGRDTYWLWAMNRVDDWWTVPYERRWMPPASVIAAFEHEGFVWGGKWLFFDTMHFEYRPEIMVMARTANAKPEAAATPAF